MLHVFASTAESQIVLLCIFSMSHRLLTSFLGDSQERIGALMVLKGTQRPSVMRQFRFAAQQWLFLI